MQIDERIAGIIAANWPYNDFYHSMAATIVMYKLIAADNYRDNTKDPGQKVPRFLLTEDAIWNATNKDFIFTPVSVVEDGKTITDWDKIPAFAQTVTSRLVLFYDRTDAVPLSYSVSLQWAYDLFKKVCFINGIFNKQAYDKLCAHLRWSALADCEVKAAVSLVRHQGLIWRIQDSDNKRRRRKRNNQGDEAINTQALDCGVFNYANTLGSQIEDVFAWKFSVAHLGACLILALFAYSRNRMSPKNPHKRYLEKILGPDFELCFNEDGEPILPIQAIANKINVRQIAYNRMPVPYPYLPSIANNGLSAKVLKLATEGFWAQAYQVASEDKLWVIGSNQTIHDMNLFVAAICCGLNYSPLAFIQGCSGVRGNRTACIGDQKFCGLPLAIPITTQIWNPVITRGSSTPGGVFSGMKAGQSYGAAYTSDGVLVSCQSDVTDESSGEKDMLENARKVNLITVMEFKHIDLKGGGVSHKNVELKKENGEIEFYYSSTVKNRNEAQAKRVNTVSGAATTKPANMSYDENDVVMITAGPSGTSTVSTPPVIPGPTSKAPSLSNPAKVIVLEGQKKSVSPPPTMFVRQDTTTFDPFDYFIENIDIVDPFRKNFAVCVAEAGNVLNGTTAWNQANCDDFYKLITVLYTDIENAGRQVTKYPLNTAHPKNSLMRDCFRIKGINDTNKLATSLWIRVNGKILTAEGGGDGWGQ